MVDMRSLRLPDGTTLERPARRNLRIMNREGAVIVIQSADIPEVLEWMAEVADEVVIDLRDEGARSVTPAPAAGSPQ